jgi:hypothetical protein
MNTVRAAPVTKSGNPLSAKADAELTLRVMPLAAEDAGLSKILLVDEVAA